MTVRMGSFIDDLVQVFLHTTVNRERESHIIPSAIHITSRPHMGPDKLVKRRGLLSDPELIAEGTPAGVQIVLCWDLNTRSLTILLPSDKLPVWLGRIPPLGSGLEDPDPALQPNIWSRHCQQRPPVPGYARHHLTNNPRVHREG
jgi:hypothetical protein